MNRVKRVNEKILFIRDYWNQLHNGKIDFFDNAYIVDLKSILVDLSDTIKRVRYFKPRSDELNYGDLPYICDEFLFFHSCTYFKKSNLSGQLLIIKREIELNKCFRRIKVDRISQYRKSMGIVLNNIKLCISSIENNNNYFNGILNELQSICLNNHNLKEEIETLKVYLSELMSAGYEEGKSSNYLNKFFEVLDYRKIPLCNIKNFLLLPLSRDKKKITYIFSIKNFYRQEPITIGNVLLYNPMRKDLLEYIAKEVWYEEDYYLLTREKQEIFDEYKIGEGGCNYPNEKYEEYILWTDCHARISIMAFSVIEGLDRAKQEIENMINLICYSSKSNLNNIEIQESYAAFDEEKEERIHPFFIQDEMTCPTYYVRGVEELLSESVLDSDSSLNRILSLNNKELLTKAIYWYNNANNNKDIHMKYLAYFISIETLLTASKEYNTIKDRLLNTVPDIIIMSAYYNELINICRYFRNVFSVINRKYKSIPEDIASIEGLENFLVRTDLNAFRNNFKIFYRYCESPYIKSLMIKYKKIYNIEKDRRHAINDLRIKLTFVFSRIYRFRNQIVHSGEINRYQIKQNTEFLRYSTHILIETAINDIKVGDIDEDIVKKISTNKIEDNLSKWINSFI